MKVDVNVQIYEVARSIFLAVFERQDGNRLGMRIECKQPNDRFSKGKAARYRERLDCWTKSGKGPRTIPKHDSAVAILLCDRINRHVVDDLSQFDGIVFFDEIASLLLNYPSPEM